MNPLFKHSFRSILMHFDISHQNSVRAKNVVLEARLFYIFDLWLGFVALNQKGGIELLAKFSSYTMIKRFYFNGKLRIEVRVERKI